MIYKTLLLDPATWDLMIDEFGNIAVASPPYSLAQDVASACSTFKGELLYDTTQGVPYSEEILGATMNESVISAFLESEALTVSGVASAQATLNLNSSRELTGELLFIDENGDLNGVNF